MITKKGKKAMSTKLIELDDNIYVEVEVEPQKAQPIAGGFAEKVGGSIEKIKPLLRKICIPIIDTWKEINKEVEIEQTEVSIGFSFESEGNIYITKAKAGANFTVKILLKPKA